MCQTIVGRRFADVWQVRAQPPYRVTRVSDTPTHRSDSDPHDRRPSGAGNRCTGRKPSYTFGNRHTLPGMPPLAIRLTDLEMETVKANAARSKISVTALVRASLGLGPPASNGRPKTDPGAPLAGPISRPPNACVTREPKAGASIPSRPRDRRRKPDHAQLAHHPARPADVPAVRHDERTRAAREAAVEAQARRDKILRDMRGGKGSGG